LTLCRGGKLPDGPLERSGGGTVRLPDTEGASLPPIAVRRISQVIRTEEMRTWHLLCLCFFPAGKRHNSMGMGGF